jgi:hypothetical protein
VTEYTRVTIQGEGRKADLVLPDDEPIAAVLPEVLSLLDETTERSSRPVVLMTTVGEQLSPALTLAEQSVEHGTILRIVRVDEAPPPPEVADVTDLLGDAVDVRSDRWRQVWGVAAAAVVAAVAGVFGAPASLVSGVTPAQLVGGLAVLLAISVVTARRGRGGSAVVLAAGVIGACVAPAAYLQIVTALDHPGATLLLWFGLAAAVLAAVGGVGFRDAALVVGGAVGALLVAAWVLMHLLGVQILHSAAWVAIAAVLLLGLLPGVAMTASGLTGLDDRVVEGTKVARAAVSRAVDTTHRSLTWATVATVVPASMGAWLLARSGLQAGQALAAALAVVMLTRTLVLPLAPQRLALIAGGSVPLLALGFTALMRPGQAAVAALLLLAVLVTVVGISVSENIKARARRLAGVIEMLAVVALIPLALWLLDVYVDLVEVFTS